ncbi:MAG: hypothetical protein ACUVSX_14715 [Aggregatilineales bacterium]
MPHFIYSADVTGQWRGTMRVWDRFEKPISDEDGNLTTHGIVTRQESGAVNTTISGLLIPATSKLGAWKLISIANYDGVTAKPFESPPRDGAQLLKPDRDRAQAVADAQAEFRRQFIRDQREKLNEIALQISTRAGGLSDEDEEIKMVGSSSVETNLTYANETLELAYLPVYIASYQFANKTYDIYVNGQTGRANGDRPVSWLLVIRNLVLMLAPAALLYGLYAVTGSNFLTDDSGTPVLQMLALVALVLGGFMAVLYVAFIVLMFVKKTGEFDAYDPPESVKRPSA